jgi:hypothetical protein
MDSESYTQQLSRETVNKLFAFYSGVTEDRLVLRENLMVFVNEFIQIVIAQALADFDAKANKKDKLKQVFNNFTVLKENIQEQVANSFSQAMRKYAGQEIDYYCLIKQVADPVNNHPC